MACWRLAVGGVVVGPGWVVRRRAEKWLERPSAPSAEGVGEARGGGGGVFGAARVGARGGVGGGGTGWGG